MFDLTRFSTTQNLDDWLKIWHENCHPGAPLYLVGSKFDRIIDSGGEDAALEACENLAKELNIGKCFVSSAKSGHELDKILDSISKDMYSYNKERLKKPQ